MKKILIIQTPSFNPNRGGVQRITFNLGVYFSQNGCKVHYYCFSRDEEIQPEYGILHTADNYANDPQEIEKLSLFVSENNFDVIINQMPYVRGIQKALLKSNTKAVTIGCIHNSLFNFKSNAKDIINRVVKKPFKKIATSRLGLWVIQYRHKLKHALDLKKIIKSHDRLFLYTPPNHEELKYFIGDYGEEKVAYMPNPINLIPSISQKEKIILHVGRINIQQKRSDLLLDFWQNVHNYLEDWSFVIVGDGPYFEQLKADLEERQLPRVQLEGFQVPEPYYQKAAVFMMPSAYEGFPNTLIEAQSFGCVPLVFNSYAALDWILNDGKDAFLVPAFDTTTMAQKAIFLAEDEAALRSMQKAAVRNAGRFTIDKVGQSWIEFFDKEIIE